MKTIEEKAKAYDKVSKEVKDFFEGKQKMYSDVNQTLEYLFPELKKSEDERIMKGIKSLLEWNKEQGNVALPYPFVTNDEALAWLEKQGKQKTIDMSIKEKAHQIAWETSKHYDPLLSKENWCEMAALDMASWLEKQAPKPKWTEEDSKMLGTLIAIFEVNYPDEFYKVNPIGTTDMQGIHSSEIVKWIRTIKQRMEENNESK